MLAWTGLRELRQQWALCRERSWTGLRERRRAADTLRRRRGLFMLKSLDTITGTTSTVSILSRTVRWHDDNYVDSGHFVANGQVARLSPTPDHFFFTKRRLPGKCRHCASAPRKLAVRAAPIVKPSCFKSIRRLPGTIKVGGRAKQRFIPPKPVGLLQHREKLGLSCLSFVRGSILCFQDKLASGVLS